MSKQLNQGSHIDIIRLLSKQKSESIDAIDPSQGVLSTFFYPVPFQEALRRYFHGKKCVSFLNGGQERLQLLKEKYMCNLDIEQLLEQTASDHISCWLRNASTGQIGTVRVSDAASALQLHAVGASLYFRSGQELADAFMGSIARELGFGPFGFFDERLQDVQGEVEIFVTRAGHRTGWHFDFQDGNFTIQLSGVKKWKLRKSGLRAPVRGATPHFSTSGDVMEHQLKTNRLCGPGSTATLSGQSEMFDFNPGDAVLNDGCEEVTLRAGDLLFFPAGMWHSVECVEDGVSLNFSCMSKTWADVASDAVRTTLWRYSQWREMASLLGVLHSGQGTGTTASTPVAVPKRGLHARATTSQGLYQQLFPSALTASNTGEAADLPAVYASLDAMRKQALQRLERSLSPAALAPPVAFLLNRLRPTLDDEEGEEGSDEDGGEDDEVEQVLKPHTKRQRAESGRAPVVSKRGKRATGTAGTGGSTAASEASEDGENGESSELKRMAGPGIAVHVRNGCILLDVWDGNSSNSSGSSGAGAGDEGSRWRMDYSRWSFVWSPLASYSSHEELSANGAEPVSGDVDGEADEGEGDAMEEEGQVSPLGCQTLVIHVNFGNADLINQLRVLLKVSTRQAHVLKTLAARADTCFSLDDVQALMVSDSPLLPGSRGSKGGKRAGSATAASQQASEALLRAAMFAGAVLPERRE